MARKSKHIYSKYDERCLKQAVQSVKAGVISLRQASKQYGIPKSTISDRLTGKIQTDAKPGCPPAVPRDIEKKVVDHVTSAASCGFGITRKDLLLRTDRLCQKNGHQDTFQGWHTWQSILSGFKAEAPHHIYT